MNEIKHGESMKRKFDTTILIAALICTLLNISCKVDNLNNKEKARTKFLQAISRLYETGGIATFESPSVQFNFRPPEDRSDELTPQQIKQMLNDSARELKEVIELDPSLKEVHYFLGVTYLKLQDIDKAIESFKKAIDVEPHKETSYFLLSSLLIEKNKFSEARSIANRYLHEFPKKKLNVLDLIAMAYFKEGDFKNAIKTGEEIVLIDSKHIGSHLLLANSYYKVGNKGASEREFKKIIDLDPTMGSDVKKMKESLTKED